MTTIPVPPVTFSQPPCPAWCDHYGCQDNKPGDWSFWTPPTMIPVNIEDDTLTRDGLTAHTNVTVEGVWTSDRAAPSVQIFFGDEYLPAMTVEEALKLCGAVMAIADIVRPPK